MNNDRCANFGEQQTYTLPQAQYMPNQIIDQTQVSNSRISNPVLE